MSIAILSAHQLTWQSQYITFGPLDLEFNEGERIAILGEEASGLSTLLRLLSGLIQPKQGIINLLGKSLATVDDRQRANMIGVLFDHVDQQFLTATVGAEISLAHHVELDSTRSAAYLSQAGLAHMDLQRPLHQLSASERYRVAVASVLAAKPRIILADEPGSALSDHGELEFADSLRALCDRTGVTMVTMTSRKSRAKLFGDQIITLTKGRIRDEGV
ncbi:MAG: ABC transporter ATP-binding protein [Magnetococcales bacterium]|nr:ABC transporter ATP-binding protein [Magnetococcales bacterium]